MIVVDDYTITIENKNKTNVDSFKEVRILLCPNFFIFTIGG
jgi:hypothetical protein